MMSRNQGTSADVRLMNMLPSTMQGKVSEMKQASELEDHTFEGEVCVKRLASCRPR
jgi:hypothetical protein